MTKFTSYQRVTVSFERFGRDEKLHCTFIEEGEASKFAAQAIKRAKRDGSSITDVQYDKGYTLLRSADEAMSYLEFFIN